MLHDRPSFRLTFTLGLPKMAFPQVLALIAVNLLLGIATGWIVASLFERGRGARSTEAEPTAELVPPDEREAGSLDDVAELLVQISESVNGHRLGIERFGAFLREAKERGRARVFEWTEHVLVAHREANRWCGRLLDEQSRRLTGAAEGQWESCREASTALAEYGTLVEDYATRLAEPAGPGSADSLLAVIAGLLEANRALVDSLEEARALVAEYDGRLDGAERQARMDTLTGLPNRRGFEEHLKHLHGLWRRHADRVYSVVLLDIDHFKQVNDRFGHAAGDAVLRMIADVLRDELRAYDHVSRWGGEEFAILSADTNLAGAVALANRVRARVASADLFHERRAVRCTVSGGAAEIVPGTDAPDDLLRRADSALYAAKSAGRNCIRTAEDAEDLGNAVTVAPEPQLVAAGG